MPFCPRTYLGFMEPPLLVGSPGLAVCGLRCVALRCVATLPALLCSYTAALNLLPVLSTRVNVALRPLLPTATRSETTEPVADVLRARAPITASLPPQYVPLAQPWGSSSFQQVKGPLGHFPGEEWVVSFFATRSSDRPITVSLACLAPPPLRQSMTAPAYEVVKEQTPLLRSCFDPLRADQALLARPLSWHATAGSGKPLLGTRSLQRAFTPRPPPKTN